MEELRKEDERMRRDGSHRGAVIVRTSVIGIVANIMLAAFKAAVGLFSNSISVILDAVNNLSDALSSVITIVGTKLAGKQPDKKHPLGYGRMEYLSALIVSAIVIYAGGTSLVESVKKIIRPERAAYTPIGLFILAAAVLVKLTLGVYVKKKGEEALSAALIASGEDARFDAILSFSVLVTALIYMASGLSLEPYVGVVIALFILKAGYEMIADTLGDILGRRADKKTAAQIRDILVREECVKGAYDLIINNYGPDRNYGSVHLELPDTMTVDDVDRLSRKLQEEVYRSTGVIMTAIGVYSYNTSSDEVAILRNQIQKEVMSNDWALQMHGFYADVEKKKVRFDVVFSFEITPDEGVRLLMERLKEKLPDYTVYIAADVDTADVSEG